MSLDNALFLVDRGGTNYHSKGSDIGDRMVAGDSVLVQRGTDRFKATYDGSSWDKIQDSDLLLAWDGNNSRKVTGANFKTLFNSLYGNFIGDWKQMQLHPDCSSSSYGNANHNLGDIELYVQYRDSNGVDHKDEMMQTINSRKYLACNSAAFGLRLYTDSYNNNSTRCYLVFSDYHNQTDDWRGQRESFFNWLKIWSGTPGPFATLDWRGNMSYGVGCSNPGAAWMENSSYKIYLSMATGGDQQYLYDWFFGIGGSGSNYLPLWLEYDNGYMLKVDKLVGRFTVDLAKCEMTHISSTNTRVISGVYPAAGGKIKLYNFFPGQFREEIRGHVWSEVRGESYAGYDNITRLDQYGNPTASSTWYGTFFPYSYINASRSEHDPMYGYEEFEADPSLGIEGVTGSILDVESTDPNVRIEQTEFTGIPGIRIWFEFRGVTSRQGIASIRGVPLRKK